MKNKIFLAAVLLGALLLLLAGKPFRHKTSFFITAKNERTLTINKNFIAYMNKQAAIDAPEEVLLFADSIIISASDTLTNFNLHLYANFFKIEPGKRLIIAPAGSGQNGKNVFLMAKKTEQVNIQLPGTPGQTGVRGRKGKDGDRNEVMGNKVAFSKGTAGGPGKRGEKGGDGGNLTVRSLSDIGSFHFRGKGAKGGAGGEGGQGGLTFFRPVTKIIIKKDGSEHKIFGKVKSEREPKGAQGPDGNKGKDGRLIRTIVTKARFELLAARAYMNDWENIGKEGWKIIFRK